MAFASDALKYMQREACDNNPHLPSAVDSGLVGVSTNPNNNSYHHSKNSAPYKNTGAYTNRWAKDLVSNYPSINKDAVCGSDQSMSTADMKKATAAFKRVFDDPSDPRRKYFAEFIGTLDGVTAVRFDFGDGSVDPAHISHTWHVHTGWWYLYWNSMEAANAHLSVLRMQTKAQYIAAIGGGGSGEDEEDMKPILGKLTSSATVWKGYGMPGTLMALHSQRAYGDIKSFAQTEYHYGAPHAGDAQALVDVLGTLPLTQVDDGNGGKRWETPDENNTRSVAYVNDAG